MKCAIMQPTYLPWSGYFNLIANVDIFVFLDDVQYVSREWQNRNRILLSGKPHWITVPVKRLHQTQKIYTIEVDDEQEWRVKHIKMLSHAYSKHPYKEEVISLVSTILEDKSITHLSSLNVKLVQAFCARLALNLNTRFIRASELHNVSGKRSEHLLKICTHLGCNEYLSPVGAKNYLQEDGDFQNSGVKLTFQDFTPKYYPQKNQEYFVSHLSIVDVVANIGWTASRDYIYGD